MTTLTANLKHFYQCRGGWFWYLILLGQLPVILMSQGSNLGFLIISFFCGLMVANIQKEILTKPFSYCLPGHDQIPRRLCLWVGVVINGLVGFIILLNPAVSFPSGILAVIACSVVGMLVYLIIVNAVFSGSKNDKIVTAVFAISIVVILSKRWDKFILQMIRSYPLAAICLGALSCWLLWRRLEGVSLRRLYCGNLATGIYDGCNGRKYEKKNGSTAPQQISSGIEDFFLTKITSAQTGSLQQYIWGSLYKSFGIGLSNIFQNPATVLVTCLISVFVVCYLPDGGGSILFIIPGLLAFQMSLRVYSSSLISGGRRERFWSGLTLGVTTASFTSVFVFVLAMVSVIMEGVMPPLTIKGIEFTFSALNPTLSFVPFVIIPFILALGLIFPRNPILRIIVFMMCIQFLVMSSFFPLLKGVDWIVEVGPLLVMAVILFLLSWGIFIWVLRYVSMRRCLVGGR